MMAVCSSSPFCLGMCEWTDCPGAKDSGECSTQSVPEMSSSMATPTDSPIKVNAHASTSTSRAPPTSKHFTEFIGEGELVKLGKGLTPANTTRCTKWALKTFELWNARNQRFPEDGVPEDLFTCTDPSLLNIHLTRFAVEARKASGEYYPPSSLRHFMSYEGN